MRPSDLANATRIRDELWSGAARRQREAAGHSMADVARAMRPQVTAQAVHYWETRRSIPTVEHALAYGRVLAALGRRAALPWRDGAQDVDHDGQDGVGSGAVAGRARQGAVG